jgi:uroporphyrinogen decarboxylase
MDQSKGRMNAKERWEALLNRQPVDRVPFFPLGCHVFSCKNAGYTVLDAYTSMPKFFEAQIKTAERYGYFPFIYMVIGPCGAEEFGGQIQLPASEYDMAPKVIHYPVQSEEDVWKLKLPDVETAGSIPKWMELSKLQESVPDIPIVPPAIPAVITIAGNLAGPEQLCKWMIRKPELVHHLVHLASAFFLDTVKYWVDTFRPNRIILYSAAPTESNQIISPKHFQEFGFPYQKEIHEKVIDMGIKHILFHICGDQNLNLPFWSQIPMGDPGIVSFGAEVDLEAAAHYFPDDIIVGNIDPPILHLGPEEEVYQLSRLCIEKGKRAPGGFMLGAGCSISPLTPSYNYWAMHKALDDFGWYG